MGSPRLDAIGVGLLRWLCPTTDRDEPAKGPKTSDSSQPEAEAMLETVLKDEPSWRDVLYEPVEFVTGGEN